VSIKLCEQNAGGEIFERLFFILKKKPELSEALRHEVLSLAHLARLWHPCKRVLERKV